jgi:carbon-monoxide dehydrogenase large subunit
MPNQALSGMTQCVISSGTRRTGKIPENSKHFRCFAMQDYTSASSLDNAIALQKYGVGQPVRRKEDDTLVRGKGKYTDDFTLPGQAYCWMVRSSHAHGIIKGIGTDAAKAMPGVLGVWTGKDLAAAGYNPFTCGLPL